MFQPSGISSLEEWQTLPLGKICEMYTKCKHNVLSITQGNGGEMSQKITEKHS
jgi:hypothetical protein